MRNLNIILHVGTEKTGTTSLQHALQRSYAGLRKKNWLFPKSLGAPCHIKLTVSSLGQVPNHALRRRFGLEDPEAFNSFSKNVTEELAAEISEAQCDNMLISDEHINSYLLQPELIAAYKRMLGQYGDIRKVVIYLRRQDELRIGLFGEAVKGGNLSAFDIRNPLPIFKKIPPRLNYLKIVKNLSEAFGEDRLVVRLYGDVAHGKPGLIQSFCEDAGLPQLNIDNDIKSNQAIDGRIIRILAELALSMNLSDPVEKAKYKRILAHSRSLYTGPGMMMSPHIRRFFMSQFESLNRQLAEIYFPDKKGDLFGDIPLHGLDASRQYYPDATIPWTEFFLSFINEN